MAMGPKKKFDFFNGGRGVDLSETYGEEDHSHSVADPEVAPDPYGYGGDCGRYRSSPMGYMPPSSPRVQMYPGEYHQPTITGSQSPPGYCDLGQNGFHNPPVYTPSSPTAVSGDMPSWPAPEDDDARKKNKRKQRCRMCANHGVYVEVKGHKWVCPYRLKHNCEKCEITKKRQYYMAEQQKLTRDQQQQQLNPHGCGGNGNPAGATPPEALQAARPSNKPSDFPRMDELVRETSNIINEDLFAMINKVVRPRAHH
uniref:DSX n=1 Tax=Sagmariasus verreauxi TaxID=1412110 RepID=A0A286QJV8_9EUCA|nr:DSX [Sagmariasus verreauxi]